MCIVRLWSHARLACAVLFLVGTVLPLGLCQNAEPRGDTRSTIEGSDGRKYVPETRERYSRNASPAGEEMPVENGRTLSSRGAVGVSSGTEAEAQAEVHGDAERRDKRLPLPGNDGGAASPPLPPPPSRRDENVGSTSEQGGQEGGDFGGGARRKKRRGDAEADGGADLEEDRARETIDAGDSRENEIRGSGTRSRKRNDRSSAKSRPRDREARKSRTERRRRRRKDRQGRKERTREDGESSSRRDVARRSSKYRRRTAQITRNASEPKRERPEPYEEPSNVATMTTTTTVSTLRRRPELVATRRPPGSIYANTVEREFSKQLELEISRTVSRDPSFLEDDIFDAPSRPATTTIATPRYDSRLGFGNSRYDAERMLGYTRTEEDLPILDLENEVLARTLKDYNAYMTSSLKLTASLPHPEHTSTRRTTPVGSRSPRKPIIDSANDGGDADEDGTTTTTRDDGTVADLSCVNGTFLPAPLSRHALIKYVKSSTPGHGYLEADYECAPGFHMVSATSRLVCRNRQWVGQVPKCEIRQNPSGVCARASCEHICNEINGRPVCSCYRGFRLEGRKCVDVNECLLNNGHGPCQDTCRNLIGSYECSCDGLQDASLAADNHTCVHIGPCSVNNAGCSHTCLSTMGRVFCLCPDGFMLEDDWKTCQDVNECSVPDLQTELCSYGCINTPGSYRCAGSTELRDQPVLDSLSITCLPGYEQTPGGTCVDINECKVDNGGCMEVCENTDGSFFCACDGDERALSSDGKSCVDINSIACLPLNPVGRGYLMCSRSAATKSWRDRRKTPNRPGTRCFLKCPRGYQLRDDYELTCRSDGTWDGPKHGKCVRYNQPRLECPKDVVAELPPGSDEAFVTFDQPATDLDWFRYVRSWPAWGTRLEANLRPGVHEITFYARHPLSKRQASCVLRIIVKDGEAPKVKDCPNDIEVTGRNGTAITWTEPTFADNVKVTRISNNESPGRRFDIGGHRIEYEASDEAGWSSKCVFAVVLRQK